MALFAIAFVLGFVIGETKTPQPQWKGGLLCKVLSICSNLSDTDHVTVGFTVPAGTVHTAFYHNLTFTQRPDAEAEQAWSDLVPGRFTHSTGPAQSDHDSSMMLTLYASTHSWPRLCAAS
jgi:hypothetical protein